MLKETRTIFFLFVLFFKNKKDTEQNSGETKGTPVNTAEKQ